ncbi:SMC-Scp complex subunit ScpB [Candidatus Pacearchaeota archaeon CG10_big_fil_rev_8_21_14_0_10_31_24]|nr:MAG: SMC-Scp complex subunit ScpB [Candidatus Pacearchaeota archaeon CG10_big_fil_rev_8_21_14_0_10_31_24]
MELGVEGIDELDAEREVEGSRKVEAALFVAGRYLSLQELVALTDVNPILLKQILEDLKERYKDRGIELIRKDTLWKMDVADEYSWIVNRLATGNSEFTKAEQETLAIIAYKQPMKQSVLVKIRGNKAYDHIANFVKMGLILKKRQGHTSELTLSESFYDYFKVHKDDDVLSSEGEEGMSKGDQKDGS